MGAADRGPSIDRGDLPPSRLVLRGILVGEVLARYEREITVTKRGAEQERFKLRILRRHPLAKVSLAHLTAKHVAGYRDDRLREVAPSTVRRELAILQHSLEVARKDWGYPLPENHVKAITMPSTGKARERRVEAGELQRLVEAATKCRNPWLEPAIILAVETGMRRGELISVRWADFDRERGTLFIRETKNGDARRIPLTAGARAVLEALPQSGERVLPLTANALRLAWERIKRRAGVTELRFHDLRHEAVSRFFELGLIAPEVALISGHKDMRMLFRYTHMKAEGVAAKLAALTSQAV